MEINNYKECIKNAKKTAMRDGYDQFGWINCRFK